VVAEAVQCWLLRLAVVAEAVLVAASMLAAAAVRAAAVLSTQCSKGVVDSFPASGVPSRQVSCRTFCVHTLVAAIKQMF
jgi:hypothetical protein